MKLSQNNTTANQCPESSRFQLRPLLHEPKLKAGMNAMTTITKLYLLIQEFQHSANQDRPSQKVTPAKRTIPN